MAAHFETDRKHISRAKRWREAADQVLQQLSAKAITWHVSGPTPNPHYHKKVEREEEKGWRGGGRRE